MMLHSLCGLCGRLPSYAFGDRNTEVHFRQSENRGNAPVAYAPEATPSAPTSHGVSTSPLVDVDALLREAAAVMRQQNVMSGSHGDPHFLALVPFGALLSEIQLEERLGSGAGGTTWKCRWRTTTVAIKLMVSTSADQLRASTREALCSRIVSHPCVVQCYAIYIAHLTEQDLDLLSAAAAAPPQVIPCGGDRCPTFTQVPLLCTCAGTSSVPEALRSAKTRSQAHGDQYQQQQHVADIGPGLVLAGEGAPPSRPRNQERHSSGRFPRSAESDGRTGRSSQERMQLESAAASRAAAAELDAEEEGAAAGGMGVSGGAAALCAGVATAMRPWAAGFASAPPLSSIRADPSAAADYTDDPLLLLRAAAAAALSERLQRELAPAAAEVEVAEVRVAEPAQLRRQESPSPSQPQRPPETRLSSVQGGRGTAGAASVCGSTFGGSGGGGFFPTGDDGYGAAGAAAAAAGGADAAAAWALSAGWWNDGSESILLEPDQGYQAEALQEELLRLGAAPGKFLTAIIMEWCDGGTLHDEFTNPVPSRQRLRGSGLASGHLLRGLGPTLDSGSGYGGGFVDSILPRSCRISDDMGILCHFGGGSVAGPAAVSSSSAFSGPIYISEPAVTSTSDAFLWPFWGSGGGGGAAATAAGMSSRSLPSGARSSMSAIMSSLKSPMYSNGCGSAAAAVRSGQQQPSNGQGRPCGQLPSMVEAATAAFGSFMVLPRAPSPRHQRVWQQQQQRPGMPGAAWATATTLVDAIAAADGSGGGSLGSGARGSGSAPPLKSQARSCRTAVLLRCALEIAQGMMHLHSLNLAHGDLSPKNVLLKSTATSRRGFICKISDFGLINPTSTGAGNSLADDSTRWGTLVYMAPEVFTGGANLKQADVYSFGAVLWHMCTGRPPHQELRPAQVLVGLATGDLQLAWPDWVDTGIARIGKACTDFEPYKRPPFEEIVQMLLVEIAARKRSARRRAADGRGGGVAAAAAAAAAPAAASTPACSALAAFVAAAPPAPAAGEEATASQWHSLYPTQNPHLSPAAPPPAAPPQRSQYPHEQQQQQHYCRGCPPSQPHQQPRNHTATMGGAAVRFCQWQPVEVPVAKFRRSSVPRARPVAASLAAALAARGEAPAAVAPPPPL